MQKTTMRQKKRVTESNFNGE